MISQTAEYALRTVVWIGHHPHEALPTRQIARGTRVPLGYLYKVLRGLARAGLVEAQRGLRGGYSLARPADQISVLDVIHSVDPLVRIDRCPLGLREHRGLLCPLHRRVDQAIATVRTALASSTIADVLADSNLSGPLCPPEQTRGRCRSSTARGA